MPLELSSQLNIKIGYTGGFTKAPIVNKIVHDFNANYTNAQPGGKLDVALPDFRSLNGLEIGLRYRIKRMGFEASWSNISGRSDVYGVLSTNLAFKDKWFLSLTEYSFGIENYFGHFGYGASLGYRTARFKTDIVGSTRKKKLVTDESGWGSKFYLIFQFPGQKVGIAFKPYIQVPLQTIDVSSFDQELNEQLNPSYQSVKPLEEKFMMYGISIVLYNGRQVK
jgi:hypothetical protein